MSLPVLLGLLFPFSSIFSLRLYSFRVLPVKPRAGGFGFWPQLSPASPFLGRFFQLLVQLRALCVIGVVLGLVGSSQNGIFVRAQQDPNAGPKNETLSVTDRRIVYNPALAFRRFQPDLEVERASEEEDSLLGLPRGPRNASLRGFQGSALYYTSPLFPFEARVHFQLVLLAANATPRSNDSTNQVLEDRVIFDQTLSLLDDSTERIIDTDGLDSIGPTASRTFTILENLDGSRNYTAIVNGDLNDETVWTWIGQFIITSPDNSTATSTTDTTSPSGKPNLKVILPVSIIGSLVVIAIFVLIVLFLRRRTRNKKQAQVLATYPPTPRAGSSDEKFEFSLVRPRGERSSILPGGTKSRSAGGGATGGSTTKTSSKTKGSGSTRGIVIPPGGPRQVENVNEYGLQFEPLDLTSGENNGDKKGKSTASSREGGSAKSPSSPKILNVISDEDELLETQQALAYRSESRNASSPLPTESTKSFSPNRPSHSNSQPHSTVQSLSQQHSPSRSQPQSASSHSRHPTISMVSHNEHNIHSRHNSRKWDSQSVKTANTAEMLVRDLPYVQYLHRIADQDGTLISVKSANSQSMEGSGSGDHGAAAIRGDFGGGGVSGSRGGSGEGAGAGTTSDHDSPISNLNPFGIPSPLPSHQQGRHPYATAGGTIAHRSSGASGSSHGSHRSSGLYPSHLVAMVTGAGGTGGDSTSQATAAAATPVVQSHSHLANAEPAPRGVAEFGSKASLGLKPMRRRRSNSGFDSEEEKQKEGSIGSGQGVSSVLGSLRLLGSHLQPNRRRRKESEEDLEGQFPQEQRQPGHVTPKKSSSSTSLKLAQISAPMPIKPTRPALAGSSSPPSSYSAPNPSAAGAYPPPAPTPTPPLGASWTKRKAVPRFDELEGAGTPGGGSGSGSTTKLSGSSTSLVAVPPPLPLPPPTQEKPKDRERERERKNSAPPVPPPRSPSRQRHHRQAPDPEPRQPEAPTSSGVVRPLPPRPLPHTPAPPAPSAQTPHTRNVPSILGGSSIADDSTIVAPSTPSTAVGYYQPFNSPPPEPEHSRDSSNDLDDMYGEEPEVPSGPTTVTAAPVEDVTSYRPSHSHSHSHSQSLLPHPSGGRPMPNPPVPPPRRPRSGSSSSPPASASMFTPPAPPPPPPTGFGRTGATKGGKGYYDPVWYPDVVQGQLPASSAGGPGGSSSSASGNRTAGAASGGRGDTSGRSRTKRPVI